MRKRLALAALALVALLSFVLSRVGTDVVGPGAAPRRTLPSAASRPTDGALARPEPAAREEPRAPSAARAPSRPKPGKAPDAAPAAGPPTRLVVHGGAAGRPLAGFPLTVVQEFTKQQVVTDEEGVAVLKRTFVEGPVRLVFQAHKAPAEFREPLSVDPEVLALTPGRDHLVTIRAPAMMLAVELVAADGAPAVGATALLGVERGEELGAAREPLWPETGRRAGGGADATAQFPLHRDEPRRRLLVAAAPRAGGAELAAPIVLEPPHFARAHRLQYRPAGRLRARVLDGEGQPIEGAVLSLVGPWPRWITPAQWPRTDASGLALVESLLPGTWTVERVACDRTELTFERSAVEIPEGGEASIELRPTGVGTNLLASGRILLHDGSPTEGAMVFACGPEGVLDRQLGGSGGSFALRGACAADVVELVAYDRKSGVYVEGCPLRVPVGSEDLVLRVPDPAESVDVTFVLSDAVTGGTLPGNAVARVAVHADSAWGRELGSMSMQLVAGSGRVTMKMQRNEGLRWLVGAFGYGDVTGRLADLPPGGEVEVPVPMTPGFARRVLVLDEGTREPVAGVRFVDALGAQLGYSDQAGWADLVCDRWPTGAEAQHPDYASAVLRVNVKFDTHKPLTLRRRR